MSGGKFGNDKFDCNAIEAHLANIARSMGVPPHMLGNPEWELDGTLDYSWLTPTHLRGTHVYSFRFGVWAEIIRIEQIPLRSGPRAVFRVRYGDGQIDCVAVCDVEKYAVRYG